MMRFTKESGAGKKNRTPDWVPCLAKASACSMRISCVAHVGLYPVNSDKVVRLEDLELFLNINYNWSRVVWVMEGFEAGLNLE